MSKLIVVSEMLIQNLTIKCTFLYPYLLRTNISNANKECLAKPVFLNIENLYLGHSSDVLKK
jgi:hypothetical protein